MLKIMLSIIKTNLEFRAYNFDINKTFYEPKIMNVLKQS